MVDLDLRALSAPIEFLRPELEEAYGRLNLKWDQVCKCLASLPIPTTVSYEYDRDREDEDFACLTWEKFKTRRTLLKEVYVFNPDAEEGYDVHTKPFDEWSGQERVEMLDHIPGLFAAAEKATKEFIEKTKI